MLNIAAAKQAHAFVSQLADTVAVNPNLVTGKTLPQFTVQTDAGNALKLLSLKGRVLLIDFWASWCMPCRAAIPHLKELYKKYHAEGFEILSISIDQNSKAWKNAMLKEGMPWQQAIDKYDEGKDASVIMEALSIQSVPFAIVLNADGKVALINPASADVDRHLNKVFNK